MGGTCTERGRETCTERERGNYPQRGTLHKKGGRVGGDLHREREGDLHRERERELPTEGDPAQKGGEGGGTCTERGRETCTERERGNYPQRGILHKKGGR